MQDHPVTEACPFWPRDQLVQCELGFYSIGVSRETQPARKTANVGIHGNARDAEGIAQDHVRSLAASPRQRDEFFERAGYDTTEVFQQLHRSGVNVLGFVSEETGTLHERNDFIHSRFGNTLRCGKSSKECRGDLVHLHIRALCGKNGMPYAG